MAACQIAIIKVGALGDVVRTTSLLPLIRARHPGCRITWITSAAAIPILPPPPMIDQRVSIGDDESALWRRQRYDWVISLDDDELSCRLAGRLSTGRLSGAYLGSDQKRTYTPDLESWFGMGLLRSDLRGGLSEANRLKRLNQSTFGHLIAPALGLGDDIPPPVIHIEAKARQQAQRWRDQLASGRRLVGLNTGAGGRWEFKKWGEGQSAELAQRLIGELNVSVVLLGGEQERDRNTRIAARAGNRRVVIGPHDWSLSQFAALVGSCDLLITSDSLAMHLALAQRVYTIAFFGPTSASEIDMFGRGEAIVTPLSCRCCYLPTCDVRPQCMDVISVQAIFSAVSKSLEIT